jgi:hypothetical protein
MALRANANVPVKIGTGSYGMRLVSSATEGTFEEERLRGKVLLSGGD